MMVLANDLSMERKIKLKSLNPHISCKICKGYLIDATTVTECLHTFCKSCLVKHLEEHNTCPTCDIVIHQSHPLNYISYDRTMQDIVYKLVSNLQSGETKREKDFYKKRGLPYPKENIPEKGEGLGSIFGTSNKHHQSESIKTGASNGGSLNGTIGGGVGGNMANHKEEIADYHRSDEQVNIVLESQNGTLKSMKRKYIRCSAHTTVTHIKKFVAMKLYDSAEKYKDIDILCNDEPLGKDHTLKFVTVTRWRFKEPPMKLCYRPRVDF